MAVKKATGLTAVKPVDVDVPRKTSPDDEPEWTRDDEFDELLDVARVALATELKRATDVDQDGMDVVYAQNLANVLYTLKEI